MFGPSVCLSPPLLHTHGGAALSLFDVLSADHKWSSSNLTSTHVIAPDKMMAISSPTAPAGRPAWCLVGLSRQKVKQVLLAMIKHGAIGEFLIRDASEPPGPGELLNLKMSVKETETDVNTYLIVVKPDLARQSADCGGSNTEDHMIFQVLGTAEKFPSLGQLTSFYASPNYAPSFPVRLMVPEFAVYAKEAMAMPDESLPQSPNSRLVARITDPDLLYDVGIDEYMEAIGIDEDGPIYERAIVKDPIYAWADNGNNDEAIYALGSNNQEEEAIYDMANLKEAIYDNNNGNKKEVIYDNNVKDSENIYGIGTATEHIYGLHDSDGSYEYDTRTLQQCN